MEDSDSTPSGLVEPSLAAEPRMKGYTPDDERTDPWVVTHRHVKTGGLYRVILRARNEADLKRVVVYQSAQDGTFWVRPASEFDEWRFERIRPRGQSAAEDASSEGVNPKSREGL